MNLSTTQRTVLVVLLAALLVSFTIAALSVSKWTYSQSNRPDDTRGITVSDSAVVKVPPDTAFVTLGVTNKDKRADNASRANAAKTSAVVKAIVKAGIPKSAVTTVNFSVEPEVNYKRTPEVIVGYTASNTVQVRTKELDKLGRLIDTAIAAGANKVRGISFDVEDKRALRQKSLRLAGEKAKGKAQAIAEAVGAKLGSVTSASESVDMSEFSTPRNQVPMMGKLGMPRLVSSTPIEPGETSVSAHVEIVYSLR